MYKNISPLGKENLKNDWYINEQMVHERHSPIKNLSANYEHTFAKARRTQNQNLDRNATIAQINLQRHHSQHLNLECDETLEIFNNVPQSGEKVYDNIDHDLLCEEELVPVSRREIKSLHEYLKRLQNLLETYRHRDMQNMEMIRKLQEQRSILLQMVNRQDQVSRGKVYYRK